METPPQQPSVVVTPAPAEEKVVVVVEPVGGAVERLGQPRNLLFVGSDPAR